MIKKDEARTIAIREWLKRPEAERTESEAALFAIQLTGREDLKFRYSGDRYQAFKGWLSRYLAPKSE